MRRFAFVLFAVVTLLVLMGGALVLVTGTTGFPGSGPLRRFSEDDLERLAAKINRQPEGSVGPYPCRDEPAPKVHVDRLRSRVIVDVRGPMHEVLVGDEPDMFDGPRLWACAVP